MRVNLFLEEKIIPILFSVLFSIFFTIYLWMIETPLSMILLFLLVFYLGLCVYYLIQYKIVNKRHQEIIRLVDELDEKYLISEILPQPKNIESQGYYYALQKACKAMNDQIGEIEYKRKDYQEYIESFVHEIKTPIAAISLYCDNEKNYSIKEELQKIYHLVEQILFYARSENPEKDYFIKEVSLEEVVHQSLMEYKDYILGKKIHLEVQVDYQVYTDEKWMVFILSQIIQNAVKYTKQNGHLWITSTKGENQVCLHIRDDGIGITKEDIGRVFEKGFTGHNRKKEYSTGMGLYLCRKLCDRLHLGIDITALEGKGTEVTIIFPLGEMSMFKK